MPYTHDDRLFVLYTNGDADTSNVNIDSNYASNNYIFAVGRKLAADSSVTTYFSVDKNGTVSGLSTAAPTVVTKTTTYTATGSDQIILCDASGGAFTVTLPAASASTQRLIFKKIDTSANAVTIARAGSDTINSLTSYLLKSHEQVLEIVSNGVSEWEIMAGSPTFLPDAVTSKTTTYTATLSDRYIEADATSAGFTITLPTAASTKGLIFVIKKVDTSTNVVTVAPNGTDKIDNVNGNRILEVYNEVFALASDGTGWIMTALPNALFAIKTVTTTYTALIDDKYIVANASGGAFTVTLPTAASMTGQLLVIKKYGTDANAVTIAPNGSDKIDNANVSRILYSPMEALGLMSDGTNWYVVNQSGLYYAVNPQSASYTATADDAAIVVDATAAGRTVTLPSAASFNGKVLIVVKKDSSSNTVTIARAGSDTIDGATSVVLSNQYDVCKIFSDGVSIWYVMKNDAIRTTGRVILGAEDFVNYGNATLTRTAAGDTSWQMVDTKTANFSANVKFPYVTTSGKGYRIDSIDFIYGFTGHIGLNAAPTLKTALYANASAVTVTDKPLTGSLTLTAATNPYLTNLTVTTPFFFNPGDQKMLIDVILQTNTTGGDTGALYGAVIHYSFTPVV